MARVCSTLRSALVVLALLCACPTPPVTPPHRALGGLLIRCEPADAMIYVDDRFQGSAATLRQRPVELSEGPHRVEVRRDGYFPHFAEVKVVKGVRQQIEVQLRKEPF